MGVLQNTSHELFCQEIFSGKTNRDAYKVAYPGSRTWKTDSVDVAASKLYHTQEIQDRLSEMKQSSFNTLVLSREERMMIISDFIRDAQLSVKSRLEAIDVLNKMTAEYTKKVEATVTTSTSAVAEEIEAILDE